MLWISCWLQIIRLYLLDNLRSDKHKGAFAAIQKVIWLERLAPAHLSTHRKHGGMQ
jgi:hypothetical protein